MSTIAIFMFSLRLGGAEKNAVLLANKLVSRGYSVHLVLCDSDGPLLFRLDPSIKVIDLSSNRIRHCWWPLLKYIQIYNPDVIQARQWPLTVIAVAVALFSFCFPRVVCSEHTLGSLAYRGNSLLKFCILRISTAIFYRLSSRCFSVTHGAAADMASNAFLPNRCVSVINNMCEPLSMGCAPSSALSMFAGARKIILSVGTIKPVKNHIFLLRCIKRLCMMRSDFCLAIVGEGLELASLQSYIQRNRLADYVCLFGHIADVASFYQVSHVFALTSTHEGFVNVLVEALYFGLDIVSTNCPTGPSEILASGKYGDLIALGDINAFVSALDSSLSLPRSPDIQRSRALTYNPDFITDKYEQILASL